MEHPSQDQIQALLRSPEAAKLLTLLQATSADTLHQAVRAAKQGDYTKVQSLLNPSLQGSQAETLARTLEQQYG